MESRPCQGDFQAGLVLGVAGEDVGHAQGDGVHCPGCRDTVVQVTVAAHVLDRGEETGLYYFYDAHIGISPRPEP